MTMHNQLCHWIIVLLVSVSATSMADEVPEFSGAELYQHFCASCHGEQARGDGSIAKNLKTPPPDLTHIARRYAGKFPTEQIRLFIDGQAMPTAHGSREMPVWGWQLYGLSSEDPARRQRVDTLIKRLVDYLQSIQR
ncbi:MAG: cytochrome c [Steroidobacteraceae bacterium]